MENTQEMLLNKKCQKSIQYIYNVCVCVCMMGMFVYEKKKCQKHIDYNVYWIFKMFILNLYWTLKILCIPLFSMGRSIKIKSTSIIKKLFGNRNKNI